MPHEYRLARSRALRLPLPATWALRIIRDGARPGWSPAGEGLGKDPPPRLPEVRVRPSDASQIPSTVCERACISLTAAVTEIERSSHLRDCQYARQEGAGYRYCLMWQHQHRSPFFTLLVVCRLLVNNRAAANWRTARTYKRTSTRWSKTLILQGFRQSTFRCSSLWQHSQRVPLAR